jgi:transcriptional regulator with GAF, ATPase, and Fis domain
MADFATLVTGPSGTGKELVARAIGFARYIPFREREREFAEDFYGSFQELNLAALPATLIESELFGHKRGAFTGATADRPGWFETCPPLGTVFLDEIGDLDLQVQVKILRVLQNRSFQRVGESRLRRFHGKVIAATHRDLGAWIERGAFREDLYYRLCGDLIAVPSLHARLRDDPQELGHLLRFLAQRVVGASVDQGTGGGDGHGADDVAAEVEAWIGVNLGADYEWPGNVRELEQCLRNVLLRRTYRPRAATPRTDARGELAEAVQRGSLTADELLRRYATQVWTAEGGNLEATARRLDLDRRTVRRYVRGAQ